MSRPCLRPLIIEPKKPLKTGAESRFRAKLDAHDNPTITLIIEPSRDLSRLTARLTILAIAFVTLGFALGKLTLQIGYKLLGIG